MTARTDRGAGSDAARNWWFRPSDREVRGRPDQLTDGIRTYYRHTWKDYRGVWMGPEDRAIHFGYWDSSDTGHRRSLIRANDVLLDAAGVGAGDRLLDAGCGVGGTAMFAASTRGASVTGVTLVPDQAARFARYARERSLWGDAVVAVADYGSLPFADGAFDRITCQEALCHAPDKARVLAELWRVLRPGGRLALLEYMTTDGAGGHPLSADGRRWLSAWFMPSLVDTSMLEAFVAGHGGSLDIRDLSAAFAPSLQRLMRLCRVTGPGQWLLYKLRLRSAVQYENVAGSIAMWRSFVAHEWHYVLAVATKQTGVTTPAGPGSAQLISDPPRPSPDRRSR